MDKATVKGQARRYPMPLMISYTPDLSATISETALAIHSPILLIQEIMLPAMRAASHHCPTTANLAINMELIVAAIESPTEA